MTQPGPFCTPANETWKAINAVHYVNISPTVEEELRPRLKEIKTSIERFTMWASGEAEQTIKAKIKKGDFKGEIGSLERNTAIQRCRASAHEEVLRNRTVCLTHTINFSHSKKFNSKTPSVPENILSSALQGFPMPPGYKGTLEEYKGTLEEELRKSIADIIGMAGGGRVRHSVLAAVLVHDRVADTIDPKLRLITFEMDPVVIEPEPVGWFRSWFSKPEQSIQMNMKFEGSEWDFSTAIWDEVYESIHPTLIEKGKELAKMAAAVSTSN